ncbi:MAG TPA: glycosyltransferase, partial [Microvirga sp.]|nr:glycosyltransferase [Microvirga sp.]
IQGGSDALLVPSRFEPCGLTQLCAMRYGSVPVVSRVGGLADTVIDANDMALANGVATGLQFTPVTLPAAADAVIRAKNLWRDRDGWRRIQRNGMAADVGWTRPARQYASLYRSILQAS